MVFMNVWVRVRVNKILGKVEEAHMYPYVSHFPCPRRYGTYVMNDGR